MIKFSKFIVGVLLSFTLLYTCINSLVKLSLAHTIVHKHLLIESYLYLDEHYCTQVFIVGVLLSLTHTIESSIYYWGLILT